jgi:hypothetical protein
VFTIIKLAHERSGHAAAFNTWKQLKQSYSNISMEMVSVFVKLCTICTTTKPNPGKPASLKPILSKTFNHRAQVDLIDMQATPDGPFCFILHYQDHLTKFTILRPIRFKSTYFLYYIVKISILLFNTYGIHFNYIRYHSLQRIT